MGRRQRSKGLVYARLASVVVLLVAVLAFHAHGSTLAVVRIARLGVIAVLLVGVGLIARFRRRA